MKNLLIIIIVTFLIIPYYGSSRVSANELVHDFLQAYNLPANTSRDDFFEFIISNATKKPWEEELGENPSKDEIKSYLFARNILPEKLGIEVGSEFEDWSVSFYTPLPETQPLPALSGIASEYITRVIMTPQFVFFLYSTAIALSVIDNTLYAAGFLKIASGFVAPIGIGTFLVALGINLITEAAIMIAEHITALSFEQKNLENEKTTETEIAEKPAAPVQPDSPTPDGPKPGTLEYIEPLEIEIPSFRLEEFGGGAGGGAGGGGEEIWRKPVLYLYPENTLSVTITIDTLGEIIESIPDYGKGWTVTVEPSGLIDGVYDYLFYEVDIDYDFSKEVGWVFERKQFASGMTNVLYSLGLRGAEIEEFITYWDDVLSKDAKYYAVYFVLPEEVEEAAKLNFSIKPDSILRVHFIFKPVSTRIPLNSPEYEPFIRKGFTVVEWGGLMME